MKYMKIKESSKFQLEGNSEGHNCYDELILEAVNKAIETGRKDEQEFKATVTIKINIDG